MTNEPGTADQQASDPRGRTPEDVWSYRGYHLRASEFVTAMVHYFRAEINRANVWRQRLDATTNWAVISTGASITIAFQPGEGHHAVIILNTLLITLFLFIEARRYRYYEVWSSRIRLMETDFFAGMLVPPFGPSPDWAESLAENLLQPHFPISIMEALGRRYRRNYYLIFFILILAWLGRVMLLPTAVTSLPELYERAAIGDIPGIWVLGFGVLYNLFWMCVGLFTVGLQEASGEVHPRYFGSVSIPFRKHEPGGQARAWFRHASQRRQLLALIITNLPEAVGDGVMKELKRGMTQLNGTGMYTGNPRAVLMCALTITEVNHLKQIVNQQDPKAFVIVMPAQEVLGAGFSPLMRDH